MLFRKLTNHGSLNLVLGFLFIVFSFSVIIPTFISQKASAQTVSDYGLSVSNGNISLTKDGFTLRWIDAAHIELKLDSAPDKPIIFTPNKSLFNSSTGRIDNDGGYNIEYKAKNFGCPSFIGFDINERKTDAEQLATRLDDGTKSRLDIDFRPSIGGECVEDYDAGEYDNFSVQNPELSLAYFVWVNSNAITIADGTGPGSFTRVAEGSNIFIRDKEASASSCKDKLILNNADNTVKWYELDSSDNYSGDPPTKAEAGSCKYNEYSMPTNDVSWGVARIANKDKAAGTGDNGSNSATTADQPSCESEGGESSWILCSALRIASSFLSFIDEQLNDFLSVPSSYYASDQVAVAWERMRNLAYLILVPIMLIMVISTALGFEFISAYTFKKALPRLVVAVLFIALSLEITKFLVIFTNDVGKGVLGLVTSSFNGAKEITLASLLDPGGGIGALFTGGVIVGSVLAIGIIPVLLLYLASAGLAIAIAVFALAFRQMLLISFMILAPLAIIAWIFPGNDKLWKLWWGSFSKLLMIFPLIMFLIGSGRAFASLVQDSGPGDFIATVLKLTAYVGPYFFIPAMFKFAGGIFATITGMVNDRGKGAFDRLKGARKKGYEKAWHRAKEGNYYKGGKEGGIRGTLNKGIMGGTLLPESGLRPKRLRDNMTAAMGRRELEHSEELMKSTEGRMLQDDDIASALIDANGDEAAFKRILQERAYKRFGGDENADALNAAVSGMKSMSRRHGVGGVRLAALRSKFNSSTGWNNELEYETEDDGQGGKKFKLDEKGDKIKAKDADGNDKIWKYSASGDMLNDINKVAGANRIMSTQLLAEARAGQSRAGRDDTGGGGFSDTAVEMDKLHRGDMIEDIDEKTGEVKLDADDKPVMRRYTVQDATEEVTRSLIKGKPIHEILRSGKPAVARAVAPVLIKITNEAIAGAENTRIAAEQQIELQAQQETDTIVNDTRLDSREKEMLLTEVATQRQTGLARAQETQSAVAIRSLAQQQMMHAVAASSSPDTARELGDKVFSKPLELEHLPAELRQRIITKTGKTNPSRSEAYDVLRDDPIWGAYTKEYGRIPGRVITDAEVAQHAANADIGEAQARAALEAQARAEAEANQNRPFP